MASEEFGIIFAYLWPDEERALGQLFERHTGGALCWSLTMAARIFASVESPANRKGIRTLLGCQCGPVTGRHPPRAPKMEERPPQGIAGKDVTATP